MIGVKPYISFPGNCEEAMNYYADSMGGQILGMQRYGDVPNGGGGDGGNADKLMHCVLKIGDTFIMAADNCSTEQPTAMGDNISLALGLDSVDDAETIFSKMSDGGTVTMPMQETFWASRFGMLKDKYGIN
ncbi:MAG TPA: VOC family protein, partial [Pyrinomonadaceae bacterium]|nr:VOC family protein [Pyrinomonadaceae bacterium]